MNSDGLSASDVALLSGNNGNNNCGWGGDWMGMRFSSCSPCSAGAASAAGAVALAEMVPAAQ